MSGADKPAPRHAIDEPAGDARPEYDQYAVNQPATVGDGDNVPEARPGRADGNPIAADGDPGAPPRGD